MFPRPVSLKGKRRVVYPSELLAPSRTWNVKDDSAETILIMKQECGLHVTWLL